MDEVRVRFPVGPKLLGEVTGVADAIPTGRHKERGSVVEHWPSLRCGTASIKNFYSWIRPFFDFLKRTMNSVGCARLLENDRSLKTLEIRSKSPGRLCALLNSRVTEFLP